MFSHCLGLALTILNDLSSDAVLDWMRQVDVVTGSELRRQGIDGMLHQLREVLERHSGGAASEATGGRQ